MALLHAGLYAVEDRAFVFVNSAHQYTRKCSKYLSEVGPLSLVVGGEIDQIERTETGLNVNNFSNNSFFMPVSRIYTLLLSEFLMLAAD